MVRKLIVAGSAPQGGEEHLLAALQEAFSHKEASDVRLPLFFTPSEVSQAAGRAFIKRAAVRTKDRDPESTNAVSNPQAKAIIDWCADQHGNNAILKAISQPNLIVHGSDDAMFPTENAYAMFRATRSAQLILYPDSGHGALFQYHETFVANCLTFLEAATPRV